MSSNNWPAQLLICGDPPGSDSCEDTSYDPTVPIIKPGGWAEASGGATLAGAIPSIPKVVGSNTVTTLRPTPSCPYAVKIEVVDGEYIATYQFDVTNAIVGGQLITYRYFTCLYSDATGSTTKRAGASVDVVSTLPAPCPPRAPACARGCRGRAPRRRFAGACGKPRAPPSAVDRHARHLRYPCCAPLPLSPSRAVHRAPAAALPQAPLSPATQPRPAQPHPAAAPLQQNGCTPWPARSRLGRPPFHGESLPQTEGGGGGGGGAGSGARVRGPERKKEKP